MENFDLVGYTRKLKELEAAVYAESKLMERHKTYLLSKKPIMPKKEVVKKPAKPDAIDYTEQLNYDIGFPEVISTIMAVLGILFLILMIVLGEVKFMGVITVVLGAVGIFILVQTKKEHKEKKLHLEQLQEINKRAIEEYPKKMEIYNRALEIVDKKYNKAIDIYNEKEELYRKNFIEKMEKHDTALIELNNSIDALYAENIIFPKYRNLVAITMINEYLESGRCDKLEGSDGAYNLYEMELRQNIIIGQLSDIVNNLKQIQNNQYSLYMELSKANSMVNEIMNDIKRGNESAKLNAYFNGVSALAAVSPKVYYGVTF